MKTRRACLKVGDSLVKESNLEKLPIEVDAILFKTLLSEGETERALEVSKEILDNSRNLNDRDYVAEAWIRMERALLGAKANENIGEELRWCVDRLSSVAPGSELHGLALLNLASWHNNNAEQIMALVTLSDISASSGHPNEVIGLARLESGRILSQMGDLEPSMRHLWMAMRRLSSAGMEAESFVSAMEWLDIALDDVSGTSPRMDDRIANAKPRGAPGVTTSPSNPDDIREAVEKILAIALRDLSGDSRDDLGLILDASEVLGVDSWKQSIEERVDEIQDSRLIESFQL